MQASRKGLTASMRRWVYKIGSICLHFGFNPRRFIRSLRGIPAYFRDMHSYNQAGPPIPTFNIRTRDLLPILYEKKETVSGRGHYFHQDLWAARKIYERHPDSHIDIGSRIDGFVAHLLTFMPVTVIDIRALYSDIDGLQFIEDDATELNKHTDNSIRSLSCLHAAEHFGLGRYSDPVDPNGCFKLMNSLQRVLCPEGRLYFSVPIGRERVEFNAHRVFAISTVLNAFQGLSLLSFSFVDDEDRMHKDVDWKQVPVCDYGCGMFEFTKEP